MLQRHLILAFTFAFLAGLSACTTPNLNRRPDAGPDAGEPAACLVTQATSCANSETHDLFIVDVNGDGKADLIAKEKSPPGNWYVALSNGSSFQPQPAPWLTGWAMASDDFDYLTADLNGDRKTDLIAKDRKEPGEWRVAISTGFAFQPHSEPWNTGWATISDAFDYFAVDVDGDGKADLIAKDKNPPTSGWHVAMNTGSAFQPESEAWLTGWAKVSEPYNLFAVDLNNDGRSDLIAKEKRGPGNWYVAINNGSKFIAQADVWRTDWATLSEPYNLFAVDLNSDGKADLIAKEKELPGNWYVAINNGSAFIAQPPWLTGWSTPSSASDLFVADINGDGKPDLISKEKTATGNWSAAIASGEVFVPQTQPL